MLYLLRPKKRTMGHRQNTRVGRVYASQKPTYCTQEVRQEAVIDTGRLRSHLLGVSHRDLTDESTDVDKHVEVHVDLRCRHDGVDDNTLATSGVADEQLGALVLLGDERRDVGLEATRTQAHDDDCNEEASQRTMGVLDDTGDSRNDEEDVAEERNSNGDTYGLVTTPSCIRNVCAEEGDDVDPA